MESSEFCFANSDGGGQTAPIRTHIISKEGKKAGKRTRVIRAASAVRGGNGRKDAADDDDERVFDEKTTRSRGDGRVVSRNTRRGERGGGEIVVVETESRAEENRPENHRENEIGCQETHHRGSKLSHSRFLKSLKTIKTVDKVAFFSGVFGLLITEAVMVKYPEKFWVFYCVAMPILLLTRMVYYATKMAVLYD